MTNLIDIKQAIGEVLEANGFAVYASEVQEGFSKPCCFVELTNVQTQDESNYIMTVSPTFEIIYVPQTQTHEHIIQTADILSRLFCNLSLAVGDRNFNIDRTQAEIENNILRLSLDFSFTDEPINGKDYTAYENAEDLEVNYGFTTSSS